MAFIGINQDFRDKSACKPMFMAFRNKFKFQGQVYLQVNTRQPTTCGQNLPPSIFSPRLFPSLQSSLEMSISKQVTISDDTRMSYQSHPGFEQSADINNLRPLCSPGWNLPWPVASSKNSFSLCIEWGKYQNRMLLYKIDASNEESIKIAAKACPRFTGAY